MHPLITKIDCFSDRKELYKSWVEPHGNSGWRGFFCWQTTCSTIKFNLTELKKKIAENLRKRWFSPTFLTISRAETNSCCRSKASKERQVVWLQTSGKRKGNRGVEKMSIYHVLTKQENEHGMAPLPDRPPSSPPLQSAQKLSNRRMLTLTQPCSYEQEWV